MWWLRVHREGRRQGRGAKESQDPEITWSGCTESQTWWEGLGHRLQVGEWEPGCLLPDVGCVTSPRHPEREGWIPMGSLGAPIRSGRLYVCSKCLLFPPWAESSFGSITAFPLMLVKGTEWENRESSLAKPCRQSNQGLRHFSFFLHLEKEHTSSS